MFQQFTDRAKRCLVLAQHEARAMGHDHLGCGHLLLALVREGEGLAAVSLARHGADIDAVRRELVTLIGQPSGALDDDKEALAAIGIDLDEVRRRVEVAFGEGAMSIEPRDPPFTPKAKQTLEKAWQQALHLDHGHVGTEHLLLGLLKVDDNPGRQILTAIGVDEQALFAEVLEECAPAYLRRQRLHERQARLHGVLRDARTREAMKPIYDDLESELRAAEARQIQARREVGEALAEEFEAALEKAERAAAAAGLLSPEPS